MKVYREVIKHYGFVIALLTFAFMAYSDYSRDGDLINLAFAVVLTALAILATYFRYFYEWKEGKQE
jgi:putative effector of murein hydrolase